VYNGDNNKKIILKEL